MREFLRRSRLTLYCDATFAIEKVQYSWTGTSCITWSISKSLGSMVPLQAMASIATIGLYIAYALPFMFRATLGSRSFIGGPFNLGVYGVLVGWMAVLWVATITLLFSVPVAYPITRDNLNYTPIAIGGVLIHTLTSWITSARRDKGQLMRRTIFRSSER